MGGSMRGVIRDKLEDKLRPEEFEKRQKQRDVVKRKQRAARRSNDLLYQTRQLPRHQ